MFRKMWKSRKDRTKQMEQQMQEATTEARQRRQMQEDITAPESQFQMQSNPLHQEPTPPPEPFAPPVEVQSPPPKESPLSKIEIKPDEVNLDDVDLNEMDEQYQLEQQQNQREPVKSSQETEQTFRQAILADKSEKDKSDVDLVVDDMVDDMEMDI